SRPVSPSRPGRTTSDGSDTAFSGADPGDVLDRDDPDLAVTDAAGGGGPHDDVDDRPGVQVLDEHLEADLGDEVHGVLGATVDLAGTALAAVAGGLADRHAGDPVGLQGLLDLLELMRLDDRGDELHARASSEVSVSVMDESVDGSALAGSEATLGSPRRVDP